MKKFVSLLLAALFVLTLAACGSAAAPAPTAPPAATSAPAEPTPAPTPAPAPEAAPAEETPSYPILVPMGETACADLDGDGSAEEICVSIVPDADGWDSVQLLLNGEDRTDSIYIDGETWFDCPDTGFWAVTDVYSADNLLEIAIQDLGPSDDYYTNFFRYEGGEIYSFGGVEGLIWNSYSNSSDLSFDEDGFVRSYMRLDVLQTWYADVQYEIAPRGVLDVVPRETYEALVPTEVTVIAPLCAFNSKGDTAYETLETGTALTLTATDNFEWVLADTGRGAVWLHLNPDNSYELETPAGYVFDTDVLDGLCMAD